MRHAAEPKIHQPETRISDVHTTAGIFRLFAITMTTTLTRSDPDVLIPEDGDAQTTIRPSVALSRCGSRMRVNGIVAEGHPQPTEE